MADDRAGPMMTLEEHFAEIEQLGAKIHAELPEELREKHQIDRSKFSALVQCACTCGAICPFWVTHLQDVRAHADDWDRLEAQYPQRILLGAGEIPTDWAALIGRVQAMPDDTPEPDEVGACCGHEYRRHLTALDGCADCEKFEPEHARCTEWRRQFERMEA